MEIVIVIVKVSKSKFDLNLKTDDDTRSRGRGSVLLTNYRILFFVFFFAVLSLFYGDEIL